MSACSELAEPRRHNRAIVAAPDDIVEKSPDLAEVPDQLLPAHLPQVISAMDSTLPHPALGDPADPVEVHVDRLHPGRLVIGGEEGCSHVAFDRVLASIHGKAAHAGVAPELGISAIRVAAEAIAAMPLGRIDSETTANIGLIKGGMARDALQAVAGAAKVASTTVEQAKRLLRELGSS